MADQEQVDLLRQGSEEWNHWRGKNSSASIDLSNADLSNANLRNADLSDANLNNADLSDANLRNADLSNADLIKTNFSYANLIKANFSKANLSKASLSDANLSKANLDYANLSDASLSNAEIFKANLSNADLSDANLSKANLVRANLVRANLSIANLNDACLNNANLNDACLNDADLINADLINADLSKANLRNADLIEANLSYANLSGADLFFANIECATLYYAVVDGETLIVDCIINDSTYAHGVGLDSARIEESLKTKLKKNIRKKYWEERYPHCINRRTSLRLLKLLLVPKCWHSAFGIVWSCIVRGFWMASDYGSSTKQILKTFGCWSLFFSVAYLITAPAPDGAVWPTPLDNPFLDNFGTATIFEQNICTNFPGSIVCYFQLWFRSLYFSVVTMTTLGFGDIHAHPLSIPGQALVMFQVLIGYVLLGVLITRLSILFHDIG